MHTHTHSPPESMFHERSLPKHMDYPSSLMSWSWFSFRSWYQPMMTTESIWGQFTHILSIKRAGYLKTMGIIYPLPIRILESVLLPFFPDWYYIPTHVPSLFLFDAYILLPSNSDSRSQVSHHCYLSNLCLPLASHSVPSLLCLFWSNFFCQPILCCHDFHQKSTVLDR